MQKSEIRDEMIKLTISDVLTVSGTGRSQVPMMARRCVLE